MKLKMSIISFFVSLLSLISTLSFAQVPGNYIIKGDVKDAKMVYFYKNGSVALTDSIKPINGYFEFQGNIDHVELSTIKITTDKESKIPILLILESGTINLNGAKTSNTAPSGTYDNDLIFKFRNSTEMQDSLQNVIPLYEELNNLSRKLSTINKSKPKNDKLISKYVDTIKIIENRLNYFSKWHSTQLVSFLQNHPKTYFTAAYLKQFHYELDSVIVSKVYNDLGAEIHSSKLGQQLKKELWGDAPLEEGVVAPNFTSKDLSGKIISLNDFKGKYVLIDFWATWCGPCRAGNPELIRLYNIYHKKGLEIIGVSDDDNNVLAWKKAVTMDKTELWFQILRSSNMDKKAYTMDISTLYSVHTLPTQYLIDKKGNIVSLVTIENLESKLKELMP